MQDWVVNTVQKKKDSLSCDRLSFANYKRKLLATTTSAASDALDANGFADAFLNSFEFSL